MLPVNKLNPERYRLYREHKYLIHVLIKLLKLACILNVTDEQSIKALQHELQEMSDLFKAHADYEESRIHRLLREKGVFHFDEVERQHHEHEIFFAEMKGSIQTISLTTELDKKHFIVYQIYLGIREFFSHSLTHFDYEEKILMPELQRLATDAEIKEIDRQSYRVMSPTEMVQMMKILFPHMNADDRFTFLADIRECEPEKFLLAWQAIAIDIAPPEREQIVTTLNIES